MAVEFGLWQAVTLFLVGIAAGFVNVTAAGGSMLSVPVMVFMGVPGPVANGTNRIAILAQNITAVFTFARQGYADFRLSAHLALAALPGAIIGAMIGAHLEGVWFNRLLAMIMILMMLLMSMRPTDRQSRQRPVRKRLAYFCMFLAGLYGGFIQIGVGFIIMPALQRCLVLDLVRVNMHKTFIIGTYSMAALLVFHSQVQLLWALGLSLAAGNSVGAWLSAHTQIKKGEGYIRIILNSVLVAFIIKLLFFS